MATTAALKPKKRRPAPKPVPVRLVGDQDDTDDEVEAFRDVPLFEAVDGRRVDSILVERTDPDEGTLGKCPPHFSEMDIKRRWGGGTFKLQARDEKNKPMKGGFRTVTIAGDPLFESPSALARWKRQQGIEPTTTGTPALSEVVQLLKVNEGAARAEGEKRLSEAQERHRMDLERLEKEAKIRAEERKAEDERRDRERRDREEREKRDREEREARQRKEDADREDRRRREDEAARVRDREFGVMLAQLQKQGNGSSGTEMLLRGLELAQKINAGDVDPLSELARNIPGILATGKELIRPGAKADDDKTLLLEGALGLKALALVEHFKRNSIDPAHGFNTVFDHVLSQGKQPEPAQQTPPPAGGAAPAPAPTPAPAAPAPAAAAPPAPAPAAPEPSSAGPIPINRSRRRRRP